MPICVYAYIYVYVCVCVCVCGSPIEVNKSVRSVMADVTACQGGKVEGEGAAAFAAVIEGIERMVAEGRQEQLAADASSSSSSSSSSPSSSPPSSSDEGRIAELLAQLAERDLAIAAARQAEARAREERDAAVAVAREERDAAVAVARGVQRSLVTLCSQLCSLAP